MIRVPGVFFFKFVDGTVSNQRHFELDVRYHTLPLPSLLQNSPHLHTRRSVRVSECTREYVSDMFREPLMSRHTILLLLWSGDLVGVFHSGIRHSRGVLYSVSVANFYAGSRRCSIPTSQEHQTRNSLRHLVQHLHLHLSVATVDQRAEPKWRVQMSEHQVSAMR